MSAVPLPDDTAVDMLSFALSGPGLGATGLFALSGLALVLAFGEVGPRSRAKDPTFFFLRITLPSAANVELLDGSVRTLRAGETVLRLNSREECTAVARRLPQQGLSFSVYRAGTRGMTLLQSFPKDLNVPGASWPTNVVQGPDERLLDARWEEYVRLGEDSDVDQQWSDFVGKLTPFKVEINDCKLCGGTGYKRCHVCGGANANEKNGAGFQCDCDGGRRRCEWCSKRVS